MIWLCCALIWASDIPVTTMPVEAMWARKLGQLAHHGNQVLFNGTVDDRSRVAVIYMDSGQAELWDTNILRVALPSLLPYGEGYLLLDQISQQYWILDPQRNILQRDKIGRLGNTAGNVFIKQVFAVAPDRYWINVSQRGSNQSQRYQWQPSTNTVEHRVDFPIEAGSYALDIPLENGTLHLMQHSAELTYTNVNGDTQKLYPGVEPVERDKKRYRALSRHRPYLTILSPRLVRSDHVIVSWLETRFEKDDDNPLRIVRIDRQGLHFDIEPWLYCWQSRCLIYDMDNQNLAIVQRNQ